MKKITKFCFINIFLMIFNLVVLGVFDHLAGGNASNGKIENGIFYLMDSAGNLIQCSRTLFVTNYAFSCVTAFFIVLGVISLIIGGIMLMRKMPYMIEWFNKQW